jgi:hypothetical protein
VCNRNSVLSWTTPAMGRSTDRLWNIHFAAAWITYTCAHSSRKCLPLVLVLLSANTSLLPRA